MHPDGGGAAGAIEAVTACLATSLSNGLAVAAMAKARAARTYCILSTLKQHTVVSKTGRYIADARERRYVRKHKKSRGGAF